MPMIGAILDGQYLPYDEFVARKAQRYAKRSDHTCPTIIGDTIEVQSMTDGQVYTSKAKLRQNYRDHGVVEVGNERPTAPKPYEPTGVREDIHTAIQQLK